MTNVEPGLVIIPIRLMIRSSRPSRRIEVAHLRKRLPASGRAIISAEARQEPSSALGFVFHVIDALAHFDAARQFYHHALDANARVYEFSMWRKRREL